jgi:hypothetical protein
MPVTCAKLKEKKSRTGASQTSDVLIKLYSIEHRLLEAPDALMTLFN